jgi:hypothetical protein
MEPVGLWVFDGLTRATYSRSFGFRLFHQALRSGGVDEIGGSHPDMEER